MEETVQLQDQEVESQFSLQKQHQEHENLTTDSGKTEREHWSRKLDFLLSCIGFAVGLGNVWRFPFICYQNGGGAFLIPYLLFLMLCGLPLFFMELSIGQYMSLGPIGCWKAICPAFQGIGYAMLVVSFLISLYYNVIISWCLYYLFESFQSDVPWKHCGNKWNTPDCVEGKTKPIGNGLLNRSVVDLKTNATTWILGCKDNFIAYYFSNGSFANCTYNGTIPTKRITPSGEFWENYVLKLTDGIDEPGEVRWQLALTLLLAWIIVYFCMWKGVKLSGKVVYFTATFPYLVLFILLIRGVTLPGAAKGIKFYLEPDFKKLNKPEVWVRAATQIFYSLGIGFGSLVAMGSYNKFHNNCYKDAISIALINCGTSIFAGFVIFSVLGFMSDVLQVPVSKVASSGPGLAFVAYPEGISQMPLSPLWAVLFFLMLLTLGLDTQFAMMECVLTGLADEYPRYLRKYKEIFILSICVVCYLVGLTNITQGGAYVLNLFDWQAGGVSLLFLAFFESICIGWLYGTDRLFDNIEFMTGHRPHMWWSLCWKIFSPAVILALFLFSLVEWKGISYGKYKYPDWAEAVGWMLALSSMVCIPLGLLAGIWNGKGSLRQRLHTILKPDSNVIKQIEIRQGAPEAVQPLTV